MILISIYSNIISNINSILLRFNDYDMFTYCSILECIQVLIAVQVADILDIKLFDSITFSWNIMRSYLIFSEKLINSYKERSCHYSWNNCQILSSKLSFIDDVLEKELQFCGQDTQLNVNIYSRIP